MANDPIENSNRRFRRHNTPMSMVSENDLKNALHKTTVEAYYENINADIDLQSKKWMRQLLCEIFMQLSEIQKSVLILCIGYDMPIRKAASKLGCSKSTAQRQLESALAFAMEYINNN